MSVQVRRAGPRHRRAAVATIAAGALIAGSAAFIAAYPAQADEQAAEPLQATNPYDGAQVYVNPDWQAAATEGGAPADVSSQPTAVWLDRRAAIEGGSAGSNTMGLQDHIDAAVEQGADLLQIVIYNLPQRDCAALASNGELTIDQLDVYQAEYIDVIADILAGRPDGLDVAATIEIDSLPNLITNVSPRETATDDCNAVLDQAGGDLGQTVYSQGVGYALSQLADVGVYNYIDIGHHGWLGWEDNFLPFADLIDEMVTDSDAEYADITGFAANVANYGILQEEYFSLGDTASDGPVRENSSWIDWNNYIDELSFAQAYQQEFSSRFGFDVGMIIDTSRNGWNGPERPTGPGDTSGTSDEYVDASRLDRRIHLGNWCNQAGAGLGERPTASPESGIHAYAWIKPPGESDGSSMPIDNDEGKGFDEMCDPDYQGNPRNQNNPSGALDGAPLSGHWFQAQFEELLANSI